MHSLRMAVFYECIPVLLCAYSYSYCKCSGWLCSQANAASRSVWRWHKSLALALATFAAPLAFALVFALILALFATPVMPITIRFDYFHVKTD